MQTRHDNEVATSARPVNREIHGSEMSADRSGAVQEITQASDRLSAKWSTFFWTLNEPNAVRLVFRQTGPHKSPNGLAIRITKRPYLNLNPW